ncbi:hypothetical protein Q669_31330 [Labrenzia sp. C1B10]|nr:hypothetical protein Q669_31330 [Labrenzia sp. C1B10]ERS09613.1 hypothetical protein Q675_00350 [Labrenzia sp. C1B70]QFT01665.1 hypothetical protein FIV06_29810 [Labrenzia sp. THAF191b]QFT07870.1 hypothetical protein FIV05_29260 [Labrenzia sp. THAF191a]QFT19264.1 hypothetical protein FIV03_28525 [Labrenzia sp. THAF187b]
MMQSQFSLEINIMHLKTSPSAINPTDFSRTMNSVGENQLDAALP